MPGLPTDAGSQIRTNIQVLGGRQFAYSFPPLVVGYHPPPLWYNDWTMTRRSASQEEARMLSHQRPMLCALLCLLALAILSGCQPQRRPTPTPPTPPAAPTPTFSPEQSWKNFVTDARAKCESHQGCSIDFEKLHEYEGRHFGIVVIGYKDSEYFVNLYRFDPATEKWIESPRITPEDGYEHIDISKTSQDWNVPDATIQGWIDEAETTVREIYSKRQ